jgi:NADPH:quinone reductase-like Zn-dependent oxidoreductase
MLAYQLPKIVSSFEQLQYNVIATPSPKEKEVLIKVFASSVNPVDWKITESAWQPMTFPLTLGFDVAGEVVAVGSSTSRIKVGDKVWVDLARATDTMGHLGAYAEYAVALEEQVGIKPASLSFEEAASLPLVALTSYEALTNFTPAGYWDKKPSVFVTSGSGGTGFLAIQMAKAFGASSITTCTSTENIDFVKSLGADVVFDYTKEDWSKLMNESSVDFVYDNYGEDPDAMMRVLKSGTGELVTIAGKTSTHPKAGVKQHSFLTDSSNYATLDAIGALVTGGKVKPVVQASFKLEKLPAAFDVSKKGGVVGKLGICVVENCGD